MARAPWTSDAVYDTARAWVEDCLGKGGSLISPGQAVWTADTVRACTEWVAQNESSAGESFDALFQEAPAAAIRVAAEVYLVHLLPIHDMRADLKRAQLETILSLLPDAPRLPPGVDAALESGVASFGSGHAQRGRYQRILLRLAGQFFALPAAERAPLVDGPWVFRAFLHSLGDQPTLQREALLHLVFPDTFEYTISPSDKSRLVRAFAKVPGVEQADNDDRALAVVRSFTEELTGRDLNLYKPWFKGIWKDPATPTWTSTIHWARRLLSWEKLGGEELEYKRLIADRMAEARRSLLDGEPDWLERLKTALSPPNNLTHRQGETAPFLSWCEANPAPAHAFLTSLWGATALSAESIAAALTHLPTDAIAAPAARLTIASVLMMGVDPYARIPYRTSVAAHFARLTGGDVILDVESRDYTPAELAATTGATDKAIRTYLREHHARPATLHGSEWAVEPSVARQVVERFSNKAPGDPGTVYLSFVEAIDALRLRISLSGGPRLDRLDAHGIAWWLTKGSPPDEWSASEQAAFRRFQDGTADEVNQGEDPAMTEIPEQAWLVRGAFSENRGRLQRWLAEGFVSIGWDEVGEVEPGTAGLEIYERVKGAYPLDPAGRWRVWTGNVNSFVNRMDRGHLVLTTDGDDLFVGLITGGPTFDAGLPTGESRRRSVEWLNTDAPASRADVRKHHPPLHAKLRALLTVSDLSEDVEAVAALVGLAPPPPAEEEAPLKPADEALAAALHIPVEWIQKEVIDLLTEKRQIVFYGPPGTGKTYVAQQIASHLASAGGEFELVQFHPSYGYEDFFEGYRPIQADGGVGVSFELTRGPLRRMAERAQADPEHPYVLIIDELNRGNVPKIFGELLFLLEYRDEQIPLQYSPDEPFGLPRNLYIIATMNTADRSIALVDAALRRRFYFVPFMPAEEPVRGVLRRWLDTHGLDHEPAMLLDALNAEIGDSEMAIGPSYFMGPNGRPPDLERVWKHAIMPLLEEHFYGTTRNVATDFGLKALRKALGPADDPAAGESSAEPEVESSAG
jgi:MoxR-like ATPase